jgi:hypothetical protein
MANASTNTLANQIKKNDRWFEIIGIIAPFLGTAIVLITNPRSISNLEALQYTIHSSSSFFLVLLAIAILSTIVLIVLVSKNSSITEDRKEPYLIVIVLWFAIWMWFGMTRWGAVNDINVKFRYEQWIESNNKK